MDYPAGNWEKRLRRLEKVYKYMERYWPGKRVQSLSFDQVALRAMRFFSLIIKDSAVGRMSQCLVSMSATNRSAATAFASGSASIIQKNW